MKMREKYPEVEDFFDAYEGLCMEYGCVIMSIAGKEVVSCVREGADLTGISDEAAWGRVSDYLSDMKNGLNREVKE